MSRFFLLFIQLHDFFLSFNWIMQLVLLCCVHIVSRKCLRIRVGKWRGKFFNENTRQLSHGIFLQSFQVWADYKSRNAGFRIFATFFFEMWVWLYVICELSNFHFVRFMYPNRQRLNKFIFSYNTYMKWGEG